MEENKVQGWRRVGKITWKWFKRLTLIFISLLLILILLAWVFEDKIKRFALEKINSHLTTEIKVKEINFSFISRFPYASLVFDEVYIQDPPSVNKTSDTLLYARRIYLDFSIWDVLSGNYQVEHIGIEDADINLYIDEKGNENYHIWKTTESSGSDKFSFELEQVNLFRSEINYINKINRQDYSFLIREMKLSGKFNESTFNLITEASGEINYFKTGNLKLVKEKEFVLQNNLLIEQDKKKYTIQSGNLSLVDLNFTIKGSLTEEEKGTLCDLSVTGNKIQIKSLLSTFPTVFDDALDNYDTKGELQFSARINEYASKSETPLVKAEFGIVSGSLYEKTSGVTLNNLSLKGNYISTNEQGEAELQLNDLKGRFEDGNFSGKIALNNFNQPRIQANLNGDFNITTLHRFFRIKEFTEASGQLILSATIKCIFFQLEENENWDIEIQKAGGTAKVNGLNLKMEDHPTPIKDFSGNFILQDDNAIVENLHGYLGKSDITINGALKNLMPYILFKNEKLSIAADFSSDLLDFDDLFSSYSTQKSSDTIQSKLVFPADINFNLDASIQQLKYSSFSAKNISGNFKLIDKVFHAKNIKMNFAHGVCEGDVDIDGRSENELLVFTKVNLSDMNISEMFGLFKNFGQKVIDEKQIKGTLTASVDFTTSMDSYLKIDNNKIKSVADFSIKNGELIEIKSLKDITGYLKSENKLRIFIGAENIDDLERRLLHIKFDELTNVLEIKDGKVNIPDMEIVNSAMTIKLFGTHGFDETIDYHFNFRFLNLKADKSETEYGTIADDGTGMKIYIHMFGNINHPKFSWDGKERKADRKEYNKQEVLNTKAILKQEFGLFKKDTTLKVNNTPEEEVKFLFDWDKERPVEEEKQLEKKKKDNNIRLDKFKKKLGVKEEEQKEFIFENE